ncbi:acyl-CoA thioester hydrolase/BAAT C-terminal domain-containing protein [Halovenus rubra]|uniref:Acyl-CoA thioester hydrolase/BAAT C-terminal domain-containing protein n=2 Tax=Halovenus rubra TaxID=869890 RepID=A0ABD5X9Y1_9EURY|nr:acyl-CoA thioester hydrolase/BAAT C-terminal domain-containing protein [Halovenus rubra]
MTGQETENPQDNTNCDDVQTAGDTEQSSQSLSFTGPETVAIDERFGLEITGVPAGSVSIEVSMTEAGGTEWTASTTATVSDGCLNMHSEPTQDGVCLPELLQQATQTDGDGSYSPAQQSSDEVTIRISQEGVELGAKTVDRTFGDPAVEATPADSTAFVGTVYEPGDDGPHPAVVVLHGSGGEPAQTTARLLASHGFVALALHYFDWRGRHEMLPQELVEVPLEFVEAASDWLLNDSRVEGSAVGLWGTSKGGEYALLSGARLDSVGPVVSVNGSGVVWQGFSQGQVVESPSWVADGNSLSYVSYTDDPTVWDSSPPMEMEPAYTASYNEAIADEIDRATISVEAIDGPVLLVSGGMDSMWDSPKLQGIAADRLERHGCNYEHIIYEQAGHGITFPYLPTANRERTQQFVMGGTQSGYAIADRDHWPKAIETLETLRE